MVFLKVSVYLLRYRRGGGLGSDAAGITPGQNEGDRKGRGRKGFLQGNKCTFQGRQQQSEFTSSCYT